MMCANCCAHGHGNMSDLLSRETSREEGGSLEGRAGTVRGFASVGAYNRLIRWRWPAVKSLQMRRGNGNGAVQTRRNRRGRAGDLAVQLRVIAPHPRTGPIVAPRLCLNLRDQPAPAGTCECVPRCGTSAAEEAATAALEHSLPARRASSSAQSARTRAEPAEGLVAADFVILEPGRALATSLVPADSRAATESASAAWLVSACANSRILHDGAIRAGALTSKISPRPSQGFVICHAA